MGETCPPPLLKMLACSVMCVLLVQGEAGGDFAQFRGPKKSCVKECILIIDTTTEEAILERISDTVQLKATR